MNKLDKFIKAPYALIGQKALVFNINGEVLMLRRAVDLPRGGGWDFAGGGLDRGEDPTEGIIREIKEESGIEVSKIEPIKITSHMENDNYVVLIWYKAKAISQNITLSEEHDSYEWFSLNDALLLDIPENMKSVLELF